MPAALFAPPVCKLHTFLSFPRIGCHRFPFMIKWEQMAPIRVMPTGKSCEEEKTAMSKDVSLSRRSTDELFLMLKGSHADDLLTDYPFVAGNALLFSGELFQKLREADMTIEEIAHQAGISRAYMYQISNGTRLPSRDVVLKLSLCLHLPLEETQRLLRCAQRGALYPRIRRDCVIIQCLHRRMGLFEANDALAAHEENPL